MSDTLIFLGHPFQAVRLQDQAVLQDYLRRYPQRASGYTFASLAAWAEPYGVMWARVGPECLLLSRTPHERVGERHLLQPIGVPTAACCEELVADARKLSYQMQMIYVSKDYIEKNPTFSAHFTAEEDRGGANYVYLAHDLADLPGGRYAKKRNLIAQFLDLHPDWDAAPLDAACGPVCRDVLLEVAHGDGLSPDDPSLVSELKALTFTMTHFDELEQNGLMIRIAGRPVAFSIFERQNLDTAAVHFEKALRTFKGLYQMINRETSRMIAAAGYHLINREEDLNRPGLRQAKLSYYPLDIYPVFDLTLRATIATRAITPPQV
ncbi:MAG: phosphatidylglycerol lysyltransferase domain-containing protein [Gemmatimonadaceae bacterium]